MKTLDKKLYKKVLAVMERPDQDLQEYLDLYLSSYPDEQKQHFIKILSGKKRQIERTTNRIINFLRSDIGEK